MVISVESNHDGSVLLRAYECVSVFYFISLWHIWEAVTVNYLNPSQCQVKTQIRKILHNRQSQVHTPRTLYKNTIHLNCFLLAPIFYAIFWIKKNRLTSNQTNQPTDTSPTHPYYNVFFILFIYFLSFNIRWLLPAK